jgi:hypothetical protein
LELRPKRWKKDAGPSNNVTSELATAELRPTSMFSHQLYEEVPMDINFPKSQNLVVHSKKKNIKG